MAAAIPTTDTDEGAADTPDEIVVAVPDGPRAAATLSCRLHGVIDGAGPGAVLTVVVEAGDRAADPDVERVLTCAREYAASRGMGFAVR